MILTSFSIVMNQYSKKIGFIAMLLALNFYEYADGLSLRKRLYNQSLSKRIRDNDISVFPMFKNLNSIHQYLRRRNDRIVKSANATPRLEAGSSALSGVPGCEDCFLGLQVSRREAYVVSDYLYSMIIDIFIQSLIFIAN